MSVKSDERLNCLSVILMAAIEDGGLNSYRQVSRYRVTNKVEDDILSPTINVECTLWIDEEEDGNYTKSYKVNLDTIAKGLGKIARGEDGCKLNSEIVEAVKHAQKDNEADYFDSYSADAVLQAGMFGQVIYG